MTRILPILALLGVGAVAITMLQTFPVSAESNQKVAQLSAGGDHTCARLEGGGLLCWGLNDSGQASPPDYEYLAVASGWHHTCASVKQDNVVCWGSNTKRQLDVPQPEHLSDSSLSAGANASCAYHYQSSRPQWVRCWGTIAELTGVNFSDVGTLAVGRAHFCSVASGSRPWCRGDDGYGQTSDIPLGRFTAMDAGDDYTCAIDSANAISCWGRSVHGQTEAPKGGFVAIGTGAEHACAITAAGSIQCWGRNNHGQTNAPGGTNWRLVSGGGSHSCAVNDDGKVACWGRNNYRQLEVPAAIAATKPIVRHKVSATASPAAGGTVSGHGDLLQGSTATLTATPVTGYRFVRWVGDAEGSATSIRFRVNAAKSVFAVFEPITEGTDHAPMISDGTMTASFPSGRIVARRLDDGRTEFGYQPQGRERILPESRYFLSNATVDRWLNSSAVIVDDEEVGQINARLLDDGRIEFAFTPTDGERILPRSRYFPISSSGNWLHSSLLE